MPWWRRGRCCTSSGVNPDAGQWDIDVLEEQYREKKTRHLKRKPPNYAPQYPWGEQQKHAREVCHGCTVKAECALTAMCGHDWPERQIIAGFPVPTRPGTGKRADAFVAHISQWVPPGLIEQHHIDNQKG